VPFFGYIGGGEHREIPLSTLTVVHPAPVYDGMLLPAEDWSSWGWRQTTAGVIARGCLDGAWTVAVGLFPSAEDDPQNFNDLLIGPQLNRTADHVMDVVPPLASHSYSGELRVAHLVTEGVHQHELEFTARARQLERHFGGDSVTDFGSVSIDRDAPRGSAAARVFPDEPRRHPPDRRRYQLCRALAECRGPEPGPTQDQLQPQHHYHAWD